MDRLHFLQQHAVPDVVWINRECVLSGFVRGVEKSGQAGEAIEIDLHEIGNALRDQAFPALEGHQLIVLASSSELQHLEQRPDGERLFEQIRLLGEEVEPENRILGQGKMFSEAPMIRRVAKRKAEGIGRALRLDVIDAQQCKGAAVTLKPIECSRDDVLGADGIMDEALLAVRHPFLPVTHVLFEDVAKLAPGDQLHEQVLRFVEGPHDIRDRQPLEARIGGGHPLEPPGCVGKLDGQQDLLGVVEFSVHGAFQVPLDESARSNFARHIEQAAAEGPSGGSS